MLNTTIFFIDFTVVVDLDAIHYHLGMAYGQLNQLGPAHHNFGLYYLRRGDLRNADFHLQEALRRTDDPSQREVILKQLAMINKKAAEAAKKEQGKGN